MPLRGALSQKDNFLAPMMYRRITITSAQWLNLLASPVPLIPAIPGKAIVPEGIQQIVKLVGTAYTSVGITDLRGVYTSGSQRWFEVPVALFTGFTDVATQSILVSTNQRTSNITTPVTNGGISLTTLGAEFAGGTADFIMWISYRVYDLANLAWF